MLRQRRRLETAVRVWLVNNVKPVHLLVPQVEVTVRTNVVRIDLHLLRLFNEDGWFGLMVLEVMN